MKKKYSFYSDPSHGWLAVPFGDLEDLGLMGAFSNYSYKYAPASMAYLEEDCDAGIFMDAAKAANWDVSFFEKDCGSGWSFIRNYPSINS